MKLASLTMATLAIFLSTTSASDLESCGNNRDCEARCTDSTFDVLADINNGSPYFACELKTYPGTFDTYKCTRAEKAKAACDFISGRTCGQTCFIQTSMGQVAFMKYLGICAGKAEKLASHADFFTAYTASTCPVCTASDGGAYPCDKEPKTQVHGGFTVMNGARDGS